MTALKINRFSLSEIESVTIRCKKCGAGHIVKLDGEYYGSGVCPSCAMPFGEIAMKTFGHIQKASHESRAGNERFEIEFDIEEK